VPPLRTSLAFVPIGHDHLIDEVLVEDSFLPIVPTL
jgi:hypothetical protein